MPLLDSFWWFCSILKKTRHFIETSWILQKPFWCFQELCKCCSGGESAKQGNKQGNKPNKFRIDRTPRVWCVFFICERMYPPRFFYNVNLWILHMKPSLNPPVKENPSLHEPNGGCYATMRIIFHGLFICSPIYNLPFIKWLAAQTLEYTIDYCSLLCLFIKRVYG